MSKRRKLLAGFVIFCSCLSLFISSVYLLHKQKDYTRLSFIKFYPSYCIYYKGQKIGYFFYNQEKQRLNIKGKLFLKIMNFLEEVRFDFYQEKKECALFISSYLQNLCIKAKENRDFIDIFIFTPQQKFFYKLPKKRINQLVKGDFSICFERQGEFIKEIKINPFFSAKAQKIKQEDIEFIKIDDIFEISTTGKTLPEEKQIKKLKLLINDKKEVVIYKKPRLQEKIDKKRYLKFDQIVDTNDLFKKIAKIYLKKAKNRKWEFVKEIGFWISQMIKQKESFSIRPATEIFLQKYGDCSEYSILFCSLARNANIPTKIVLGLVYIQGGFFYHAWNEVYINKKWYGIDTTLQRYPIDAKYIKLIEIPPCSFISLDVFEKFASIREIKIVDFLAE